MRQMKKTNLNWTQKKTVQSVQGAPPGAAQFTSFTPVLYDFSLLDIKHKNKFSVNSQKKKIVGAL